MTDIGRMSSALHRSRRLVACLAVLTPLAVAATANAAERTPPSQALMVQSAAMVAHTPCGERSIEHPFTQWEDVADYFLVTQGDVSGSASEWDLFNGGEVVADNNPFSLHTDETASLALTAGETVTAPLVCVGTDTPTMRFFAKNTGAETGTLRVSVTYEDSDYDTHTVDLATLTSADAGAEWTPSPVVDLTAPLVALLEDDETPVWFSFSAEGEGSSWQVDDVYVDPYGKG
jgi:hypothetical protein